MLVDVPFIKVVLLRCDVFETTIADERNFNSGTMSRFSTG